MTIEEQEKLSEFVKRVARDMHRVQADVMAVMQFLEPDADLKIDREGAHSIIGRVREERQRTEELRQYREAKHLVRMFEEDYPQYKDKNDSL